MRMPRIFNRMGSPAWLKVSNALVKTGVEIVVEKVLGKMLGDTIPNVLLGIKSNKGKLAENLLKSLSKGAGARYILKSAGQEGLEEFLQDFSTDLIDKFTATIKEGEGYGKNGVNIQTLIDSFFIGALSSVFLSGGAIAKNAVSTSIKNAKLKKATGIDGLADLYVDTKEGRKKIKGAQKLRYQEVLGEFQECH